MGICHEKDSFCVFSAVHGYSFGNGAWLGGGVGVFIDAGTESPVFPLFFEVKYDFIGGNLSPFIAGLSCQAFSGIGYFDNLLNFTVSWNF